MLYAKLAIALAVFAAGSFSGWWVNGWRHDSNELEKQRIEAKRQEGIARQTHVLVEQKDAQIRAVNDRLADALVRLRNRPERRAEAAAPACEGATGVQLSGPDSAFLEREAARADTLRAALGECYGWIDAVTRPGGPE